MPFGFGWPVADVAGTPCNCCGAATGCDALCQNCTTLRFSDDFTLPISPPPGLRGYNYVSYTTGTDTDLINVGTADIDYTDGVICLNIGTTHPGTPTGSKWASASGFMTESWGYDHAGTDFTGSSGAIGQLVTVPALNGLCISVCATIWKLFGKTGGTTGIFIGNAGHLFGRKGFDPQFGSDTRAGAEGCYTGAGTTHLFNGYNPTAGTSTFIDTDFPDGAVITLSLQDASGGAGTYNLLSYVSGHLADTFTGVAITLTPGTGILCGMFDTNGGKWSCFRIATS